MKRQKVNMRKRTVDRQCSSCGGFCKKSGCERENTKPKREWVGLTEEEAVDLLPVGDWEIEPTLDFAKAIEAKLKEKNT